MHLLLQAPIDELSIKQSWYNLQNSHTFSVINPFFKPLFTVVPSDAKYNIFFPMTSETPLLWKVSRYVSIKPSEVWEIAFLREKNFNCTSCMSGSEKIMYISSFSVVDKSVDPSHKKESKQLFLNSHSLFPLKYQLIMISGTDLSFLWFHKLYTLKLFKFN